MHFYAYWRGNKTQHCLLQKANKKKSNTFKTRIPTSKFLQFGVHHRQVNYGNPWPASSLKNLSLKVLHIMTIMRLNFNIVLSKLQFSSLQLIFTPPFLSAMMHALTIIVIVNHYCCCDFSLGKFMLGLKNSQKREELGSTSMTHPFFPFINDNLNQTTSEKSSFLASLSTAPSLFTVTFQTFAAKVNAKVSIPCQIHKSNCQLDCDQTLQSFYPHPLGVVTSCNLSFYEELLKTNGL